MNNQRLQNLLQLLENTSKDPFLYYAVAMEYQKAEDFDNARKYYQILLDDFPEYSGTYYHYAALLDELGEIELALACYEKGIVQLKAIGDQHAFSELQNAFMNFKIENDI